MSLTFYAIEPKDIDALMEIEIACHSHPWSKKVFSSCIGGRYFGQYANDAQHTIGFYVGEVILDEATLMDICIDPQYQGEGHGKALLTHFVKQAQALGAISLFLEVRASNIAALMMYINAGFIEISRRTGYYPCDMGYEDAIVMKCDIKTALHSLT